MTRGQAWDAFWDNAARMAVRYSQEGTTNALRSSNGPGRTTTADTTGAISSGSSSLSAA